MNCLQRAIAANCLIAVAFGTASLGARTPSQAADDTQSSSELREDILNDWRRNQKQVTSARFQVTGVQNVAKVPRKPPGLNVGDDRASVSEDYLTGTYVVDLLIAGVDGWSRIETNKEIFDARQLVLVPAKSITAFDGLEDGSRRVTTSNRFAAPIGNIYPQAVGNNDIKMLSYKAMMLALRPFAPSFVGQTTLDRFENVRAMKGDQSSEGLVHLTMVTGTVKSEILVEAGSQHRLKQFSLSSLDGTPLNVVEVNRCLQDDGVWFPEEWSTTYYQNGRVIQIDRMKVKEHFFNQSVPQNEFRLTFDEGTLVTQRGDVRDGAGFRYFEVQRNNKMREITQEAFNNASAQGLLAAHQSPGAAVRPWMIALNVVVIVILIALGIKRYRAAFLARS